MVQRNCFDKSSDVTKYGKYKPIFNYERYELKIMKTDLDKYKPWIPNCENKQGLVRMWIQTYSPKHCIYGSIQIWQILYSQTPLYFWTILHAF